jgi:hypothetical protein
LRRRVDDVEGVVTGEDGLAGHEAKGEGGMGDA